MLKEEIVSGSEVQSAASEKGVSRRELLRSAAFATGGAAILVGTVNPAIAKMSQKVSGYQTKPKGDASCSKCSHFQPPASCALVDGTITPDGWCRFFVKKAA